MKKIICILVVLTLCLAMAGPVWAVEDTFVPSISYKDSPDLIVGEIDGGENVTDCLVITSIKAAQEKTTDINQEDRDLLLEVYAKLENGQMKLPIEGRYVIRELLDLNWKQKGCVESGHSHEEDLNNGAFTVTISFDMGISQDTELEVYSFHNGQWDPVKEVKINEDGTVTCVFEHFCPVAFAVRQESGGSQTGDAARSSLMLYSLLMVLSTAAVVVMVANRRKFTR